MENEYEFSGEFTEVWRRCLRGRRRSLNLTYLQLGTFIGVHWSTVRKWECGVTVSCHPRHWERVRNFLEGYYDGEIQTQFLTPEEVVDNWSRLPACVRNCLERVVNTYGLCEPRPELRERFVNKIDQTTRQALANFVNQDRTL